MTNEKRLAKSAEIEFNKAEATVSEDGYTFSGYASVFNGIDSYGDTILPGAFGNALKTGMPKMFFNHDKRAIPVGKWTRVYEDEKGLRVEGELTKGVAQADDLAAALKAGTVDGLSIGFYPSEEGLEFNEQTGGYVISDIERLLEISVVTFPADSAARIKAEDLGTIRDIEDFLRDAGLSGKDAKAIISRTKAVCLAEYQRDAEQEKNTNEILAAIARLETKL